MAVAAFSAITAIGLGFWWGIPFTQGSSVAPTIILTIAIADGVHILVSFSKERRAGRDHDEALIESLRINWQPVFLTSLTTAIGFLSLNYSDNAMFRDLGNLTALGVSAAWLFSITFLPAFVSLTPYRIHPERTIGGFSMERFAEWMIGHRRRVLLAMSVLLVAMGSLIPRIELNDTFTSMFDQSVPFRRDLDFMSQRLPGLYMFHYSLMAGDADAINEPAYWETLDALTRWLREQPEVTHVNTLSDTLKRLNRSMHGDDPAAYQLPATREQSAQYLLLYEMSLPYGLDLNNQINVKRSSTKLTVTIRSLSSRGLRELDYRIQGWLRANAPAEMHVGAASPTLMFAHMSERNVLSMINGTVIAFALISVFLALSLRSLKLGVLSLVPNVGPTVIAFGIWAMVVGEAGFSVAMVSACSLGIIVDATVHFLSKYLRARRERGAGAEDAVRYAISTVGAALWITFLVLIIGFSVLTLSPIETNSLFGLMIAITIAAALLTSFLLLPTLLIQIEGERDEEALPAAASS
jgi:predicted RND superfamily exporter protein